MNVEIVVAVQHAGAQCLPRLRALAVPFCRCPEHPAALLHWVLTDIGLTDGFCREGLDLVGSSFVLPDEALRDVPAELRAI